jgi:hypothetical protein
MFNCHINNCDGEDGPAWPSDAPDEKRPVDCLFLTGGQLGVLTRPGGGSEDAEKPEWKTGASLIFGSSSFIMYTKRCWRLTVKTTNGLLTAIRFPAGVKNASEHSGA